MSFVNVLAVRNEEVCFFSCHYRTAVLLCEKGIDRIFSVAKRKNILDAGWLVIDCNTKTIISNQNAFPAKALKNWAVVEV